MVATRWRPTMTWIPIPSDAIAWFRGAFAQANRAVAELMQNVPSIRETSLDDALINALIPHSAPRLLPSRAAVRMDIHNIGGLRRFQRWEVADIAIVVFVIRSKRVIAQKIGLLQSKRLYPTNNDVDGEDSVGFQYGLNAFLRPDPSRISIALKRRFVFNTRCVYAALEAGTQTEAMQSFSKRSGHDVHYLLYNPPQVPLSILYPVTARKHLRGLPRLGARVASSDVITKALASKARTPTLKDIFALTDSTGGERLEYWAADLLLNCKVGRTFSAEDESQILSIIERRSGPIGAAIAVSIELPEGA